MVLHGENSPCLLHELYSLSKFIFAFTQYFFATQVFLWNECSQVYKPLILWLLDLEPLLERLFFLFGENFAHIFLLSILNTSSLLTSESLILWGYVWVDRVRYRLIFNYLFFFWMVTQLPRPLYYYWQVLPAMICDGVFNVSWVLVMLGSDSSMACWVALFVPPLQPHQRSVIDHICSSGLEVRC